MEIKYEELQEVLNSLTTEITNLNNLKSRVQALLDNSDLTEQVRVYSIRYIGVLDDIFDKGGVVTAKELSDIAKKWGRDPRGTAGYYTGDNPSLLGIANNKRALTDKASNAVTDFRNRYGIDWKTKINMDFVGNIGTDANEFVMLRVEE
jgi:hypothetical protein